MVYEYPLTFVESDGQNFKQFIVPITINGTTCFGLIDTGASITTISFEVAQKLGLSPEERDPDGDATFVGGFPYYYTSVESQVNILPPNEKVLDDMWAIILSSKLSIADYYEELTPAVTVCDVPIRILTKPMAQFAEEANWDHPTLQSRTKSLPPLAILGVRGFIDNLVLVTTGPDAFQISSLNGDK